MIQDFSDAFSGEITDNGFISKIYNGVKSVRIIIKFAPDLSVIKVNCWSLHAECTYDRLPNLFSF